MASAAYRFDYSSQSSGIFRRSESAEEQRRQSMLRMDSANESSGSGVGGSGGAAGGRCSTSTQQTAGMGSAASFCCGVSCANADGEGDANRCTAARVKSCLKMFLAQLFSHVGLCALVVGYSVMGAFIFKFLEMENELVTRNQVGGLRGQTLDQLYNITGRMRTQLVLQEARIEVLMEQITFLSRENRECGEARARQRRFLSALIRSAQGDNVPLSPLVCGRKCAESGMDNTECNRLCTDFRQLQKPCAYWQFSSVKKKNKVGDREEEGAENVSVRTLRSMATTTATAPAATATAAKQPSLLHENPVISGVRRHKRGVPEMNAPVSAFLNVPVYAPLMTSRMMSDSRLLECERISCVFSGDRKATVCFRYLDHDLDETKYRKMRGSNKNSGEDKHFNILWYQSWTEAAERILLDYERKIVVAAKTEGYDGKEGDNDNDVQWNFSGSLMYSVTVITTIGYGNISPKTKIGRIVTMVYAIFGMPLFLMWASQMGTLLARTFQFLYGNVCCIVCTRGKRRREAAATSAAASAAAAAKTRHQEQLLLYSEKNYLESKKPSPKTDSAEQQERTLMDQDILDPGVKELLSTCAKYNLDEGASDCERGYSAEILEEIRHAEAISKIKSSNVLDESDQVLRVNSSPTKTAGGHRLVVKSNNSGGAVVTSLLKTPAEDNSSTSSLSMTKAHFVQDSAPDRVPVLPVLAFVFGYIVLGAIIFSEWEEWSFLEGAYFSFITLTTIGFGDFVPGDKVLNVSSKQGQAKLIIACVYVLMGLAVVAMSINLVQEEIIGKARQLAKDMGIIEEDEEREPEDNISAS